MEGIKQHPGYYGAFTRNQVDGAWPNGSRVIKIKSETGDTHRVGERATVLGSMFHADVSPHVFYFIEWDASPGMAVGCAGWKLEWVKQ